MRGSGVLVAPAPASRFAYPLPLWNGQLQLGNQSAAQACGAEIGGSREHTAERDRGFVPLCLPPQGLGLSSVVPQNNRHSLHHLRLIPLALLSRLRYPGFMYKCVCTSIEGFIQQLAVSLIPHGYVFYVMGCVPEGKDPERVDAKLIERYSVDISKWTRARQKRRGIASVQYLRYREIFVLIATHGEHQFFTDEAASIRDLRRVPLKAFGYSLSSKRGHAHVRIERDEFTGLKAFFLKRAVHRRAESLELDLCSLPYEPYAPVRRQLLELLRGINRARRAAGFVAVPVEALRFKRRIVRPFGDEVPLSNLVGGRRGELERGGGASSSPAFHRGSHTSS